MTSRWIRLMRRAANRTAALGLLAAGTIAVAAWASTDPERTTWGKPVRLGEGTARTYVVARGGVPREIGVALSEGVMRGLPKPGDEGSHRMDDGLHKFDITLPLPKENPTPFPHVLLNWNPGGHEPPEIYDTPHFDFHFYMVPEATRLAIDPADPRYQAKAERKPEDRFVPRGYVMPEPMPFPQMGVHWVDPASPELNGAPFTQTFIFGTWDGQLIFAEPMITKAFLEMRPDVTTPIPQAATYASSGYQPTSYTVRWVASRKEWRIALTGLTWIE
jgi:hypothetical protein